MAPINTRNHIVLDKESLQKYVTTLGTGCIAIFEIDLKEDMYGTLVHLGGRHATAETGSRGMLIRDMESWVHEEDLQKCKDCFERNSLRSVIRGAHYEDIELRCLSHDGTYRWIRILITPDEIEKDTILCFVNDIDDRKRCEFLEKKNAELSALIARLYSERSGENKRPAEQLLNITMMDSLAGATVR